MSSSLTRRTKSRFRRFMEELDLRTAVYEYLRDNMSVSVSTERELDYYDEYTVISVSIMLRDPELDDWVEVAEGGCSM